MKEILFSVLLITSLASVAQTDTLIWDYTKKFTINNKYPDGYHIFKKNGVVVQEGLRQNNCWVGMQKEYYDNGNPKAFKEYKCYGDYGYLNGAFVEFYETGVIKTEGKMDVLDSVECVNCYGMNFEGKKNRANTRIMRAGIWKEFHPNGQLKTCGVYKGIHETSVIYHEKNLFYKLNEPVWQAGGYREEYLKDGLWLCYNDKGQLVKEEIYYKGMLAVLNQYEE